MLKAALIGLGAIGRVHFGSFIRLDKEKNQAVKLAAVCDFDKKKFEKTEINSNLGNLGAKNCDFSKYNCYTSVDEMLSKEKLDLAVIALPTYLHCEYTVKCLENGINVLCEKPAALNPGQCQIMIDAAKRSNKKLMIGHCLRFWGEYEAVKKIIDSKIFGKPIAGSFFRGGDTPTWSYNNWLTKREYGGGALFDQHIHDTDIINYFFGMPAAVSSLGRSMTEGGGYDIVTTQYIYDDRKPVNAQNDWLLAYGGSAVSMSFRVNFEGGSVAMSESGFIAAGRGEKPYVPEYDKENAYYKELKYFADCIINDKPAAINPPRDSMNTLKIIQAEIESADNGGRIIGIK